ncbi:hypothetical protein ILFOPFJJ_06324 [Ensifer psoraleae]|nr:hypothetical protein [Sinorhizobium psoraleae]
MVAIVTTPVNPICIASSVARIALSTDAQPLIPHAQGRNSSERAPTWPRPRGRRRGHPQGQTGNFFNSLLDVKHRPIKLKEDTERCRRFLATKAPEAARRAGQAIERQFLLVETAPALAGRSPKRLSCASW